jgi:hypothetical protein
VKPFTASSLSLALFSALWRHQTLTDLFNHLSRSLAVCFILQTIHSGHRTAFFWSHKYQHTYAGERRGIYENAMGHKWTSFEKATGDRLRCF